MLVSDLPLPLRLRNALLKAGFSTDLDVKAWFDDNEDVIIPGVGATGMRQLTDWVNEEQLKDDKPELREVETPEEGVARGMKRHDVVRELDTAMRQRLDDAASYAAGHDIGMRGGLDKLESLDARRPEAEAVAVRRRQFDAALEREHLRSLALDGTGSFGDPAAVFRSAGGSVDVKSGQEARGLLALRLESDIQARITGLIPTIKALPHVKELGVEVSAETVGRMALIRGLDSLERAHKTGAKAENRTDQPENREDQPVSAPPEDAEELSTPEGWTKVGPNDKIPVPEAVLHDYYTQNGWSRYWGMVDGTPIYFYWSSRRSLQDLDPFPGSDKAGRKMAVQETPWGPGHVVPVKWANS